MEGSESITQIGKYKVLESLGRGSMGVVYKAEDPEIGRTVAIKTLRTVYLGDDSAGNEALQRFRQESRSAGKLRHPNIVTIFEAGRTETGTPFIVMEFIEGTSLEKLIAEQSPIDPIRALHYLAPIASAIDYAHSEGIIHRDIKPSNIIVDSRHHPFLLDFGVAKLSDTSLTPAGTVVGTPSYMSPEQIRGETLDGGTDRFAFAVVLFEMITGKRPFPGSDFTTVVTNIIHKPPLSFAEIGATNLPKKFEEVMAKGLEKDRALRFPTCEALVRAAAEAFEISISNSGVPGYSSAMVWQGVKNVDATMQTAAVPQMANVEPVKAKVEPVKPAPVAAPDLPDRPNRSSKAPILVFGVLLLLLVGGIALLIPELKKMMGGGEEEIAAKESVAVDTSKPLSDSGKSQAESASAPTPAPSVADRPVTTASLEKPPVTEPYAAQTDDELASTLGNQQLDETEMVEAIDQAAKRSYERFGPILINLSSHPNFQVRVKVIKVFGSSDKFRTKDVFRVVVQRLSDPEWVVRGFAAQLLGTVKNEAAVRLLEGQLKQESNEIVTKIIKESIESIRKDVPAAQ